MLMNLLRNQREAAHEPTQESKEEAAHESNLESEGVTQEMNQES